GGGERARCARAARRDHRPHPPRGRGQPARRRRRAQRARRPRGRRLAAPRPAPRSRRDRSRRRQPGRRRARARDGGRVLEGAPAVRPAHRLLPGAQAHGRRDGVGGGACALARLVRGLRVRPPPARGGARSRDRQGAAGRGLQPHGQPLGADARRDRLHLGARPAPLVQARALERGGVRGPRVPPRAAGDDGRVLTALAHHLLDLLAFTAIVVGPLPFCLTLPPIEPRSAARVLLAVLVTWCLFQACVGLALGAAGWLSLGGVLPCEATAFFLGLAVPAARRRLALFRIPPPRFIWPEHALVFAFGVLGLTLLIRLATTPITDHDSLAYHLPAMAGWYQAHALVTPGPVGASRYAAQVGRYPFDWEVLCTLFLLPFREDFLVAFPNLIAWLIFGLATYLVAAFWYGRNLAEVGNPLGFVRVAVGRFNLLPGFIEPAWLRRTSLASVLDPTNARHWRILAGAVWEQLRLPFVIIVAFALALV